MDSSRCNQVDQMMTMITIKDCYLDDDVDDTGGMAMIMMMMNNYYNGNVL